MNARIEDVGHTGSGQARKDAHARQVAGGLGGSNQTGQSTARTGQALRVLVATGKSRQPREEQQMPEKLTGCTGGCD